MKYTVVTADQNIYEIAYGLRNNSSTDDPVYRNLILMIGTFHLTLNYMSSIGKIMGNSGAEIILSECKILKPGTANKIFGSKPDYYQGMHAHKLLNEAMSVLHFKAFEEWYLANNSDKNLFERISIDLNKIVIYALISVAFTSVCRF